MAITGGSGSGGSSGTSTTSKKTYGSDIFYKPSQQAPSKTYSGPTSAPAQTSYSAPVDSGGGYGGGSYGGGSSSPAPVAAPAPTPMKDVDWFNQDSIYRGETGRALTDLTSQLAQILADRDSGYRTLDRNRGELDRGRQSDLTDLGGDFAGRGLLGSGLFAQSADEVAGDYARQGSALDESANTLAQQYGKRDSMVNLGGLKAGADLASIYGLLGAMGMGAGNSYNAALGKARADSAGRATGPLVQTMSW